MDALRRRRRPHFQFLALQFRFRIAPHHQYLIDFSLLLIFFFEKKIMEFHVLYWV